MWCNLSDEAYRVPGLPPMYDHEYYPQEVSQNTVRTPHEGHVFTAVPTDIQAQAD